MFWHTVKALIPIWRRQPFILLTRLGAKTKNPRVCVSLCSNKGNAPVHTFEDNDSGNARAECFAKAAMHITGLPLLDVRKEKPNAAA